MTQPSNAPFSPGLIEGQTLNANVSLSVDVVVIGSGAGGAIAAERFANAGLDTVVLEAGGYFTKERFRMQESDCYPHLYQESAQRVTKNLDVAVLQGRSVGGGTTVNWTTSYRTPEDVVALWQNKHEVKGFEYADLLPHYLAIEERLNIHETPEALLNKNNQIIRDGCRALGYESHLLKRNVRGCAQTGYCGFGCPIDAKQSMTITYLPDAMDQGARIFSRASVDKIIFKEGAAVGVQGHFLEALGRQATGQKFNIKAKRVVMSAGAINGPAIGLRSNLPDPHSRLGKRTFLHPVMASIGKFKEAVNPFYGAPQSVASHQFSHRGDKVGYFIEAMPLHPVIAASYFPGYGQAGFERLKQMAHFAPTLALAIDGHHDDVTGGEVKLHDNGAPYLDYVIGPKIHEAYAHAQKELAKIQLAAGAEEVLTLHRTPYVIKGVADLAGIDDLDFGVGQCTKGSAHQMGGCAMGEDPSKSVVNSTLFEHHQVKRLHVLDGSLFPTSLGVNPQESIFGLARLGATRIIEEMKRA